MLFKLMLIVFTITLVHCDEILSTDDNKIELILAEILFRHGARTTYRFYPTDPHKNETFHPFGLGALTKEGKIGEYNLGIFLKDYYKEFLGHTYNDDLIEMRSTHTSRTKMSALLVLAGMYPPNKEERWHPTLNWQPIPILSKFKDEEDLLSATNCPFKANILKRQPNKPDVQKRFIEPYLSTFKYIEDHSGFRVRNPHDALEMYFILSTESEQNLTLPEWTKQIYPEPLTSIAAQVYSYWSYDENVKKINIGYFLKKILIEFDQKINGTLLPETRKMFLYAGHESTLGYVFDALNLSEPHIPPYGSAIMIELVKYSSNVVNKGNYYVRIKYHTKLNEEPELLDIPGCGKYCPILKFKDLYKFLIPEVSFATMCQRA